MKIKPSSFKGIIGIAQEDITPPVGIYFRNWGASKYDVAEGIHRSLFLTCITFQSSHEEKPLVLVAADLGFWKSLNDEWYLRSGILKRLALEHWQLMFCLTHTHAGPSIYREDASKPGGEFVAAYLDRIQETSISGIRRALASATSATLTWHYGKCTLAADRDFYDPKNDRFGTGYNPAKSGDDTLLIGRITNDNQSIIATIVNYACHPTTLAGENSLISPDYIGAMREMVELETQGACLFLQGASGDLAPAVQYVGDPKVADSHGRQLGHAVLATLEDMLPPSTEFVFTHILESGAPLAVWETAKYEPSHTLGADLIEVELPLKKLPSVEEIERQWQECEDRVLKEKLLRKLNVRKAVGDGNSTKLPLWVWQLGDSFLIGQPNEAYSNFQRELRQHLHPGAVGVMNITNGWIGYLPPQNLYDREIYSVIQTPFERGALEQLTKTAIQKVEKMNTNENN